ncbi:DUF4172 domain-containing protein [Stenotrophomonas sp. NPDC077659]|uniref:DUF4172 domain-containing protein n=1 Tax=Stenotrophomonas sp. NPDC077659 TaxID=3390694 RepID=UPI003CFEE5B9
MRACDLLQRQLLGMERAEGNRLQAEDVPDTLLSNIVTSSAIEGERLDVGTVRSSLARRLGVVEGGTRHATTRAERLVNLMLDATRHAERLLDLERFLQWHRWLPATHPTTRSAEGVRRVEPARLDEVAASPVSGYRRSWNSPRFSMHLPVE